MGIIHPLYTVREAPWWVCTPCTPLGGTLVGMYTLLYTVREAWEALFPVISRFTVGLDIASLPVIPVSLLG